MNNFGTDRYCDHGVAAKADETRASTLTRSMDGTYYFTVFAKGFVININLSTGNAVQVKYPENHIDYPFTAFCSKSGLLYSSAGRLFMEFDPVRNEFTYFEFLDAKEDIAGFGFGEDQNGFIYFGSYPSCRLFCYNAATKYITDYGKMDDSQMYMTYIAVDSTGWIYMGIGTEKRNLAAFNPQSGEKKQLCSDTERAIGSGYVHIGADGCVYGHCELDSIRVFKSDCSWKRYYKGEAEAVDYSEVSPSAFYNNGFKTIHSPFIDPSIIKEYEIADNVIVFEEINSGKTIRIDIDYETEGATISPIVEAHGRVYGTSHHPLHFFSYDPVIGAIKDFGGKVIERGGGGNICAYAVQGNIVAGAVYAGGLLHLLDTSGPLNFNNNNSGSRNPTLVTAHEEIYRPRCAVACPDGQNIIYGGFAGYGMVGGALCIYNIVTGQDILIPNERLVPYHSTLCLRVLSDGNLIAGTSINAPGGAHPKVKEAEIYIMDTATHEILYHGVPIKGETEISLMELDKNQLAHCITSKSLYFVFDTRTKAVINIQNLSQYGSVVRDGIKMSDCGKIYGLLSNAIYSIDPDTFEANILSVPPVTISSGMCILYDKIYFGSGSHLWSYKITQKA